MAQKLPPGSRLEAYRLLYQTETKLREMGFFNEASIMDDFVTSPMFGEMTNEEQDQINKEYEENHD